MTSAASPFASFNNNRHILVEMTQNGGFITEKEMRFLADVMSCNAEANDISTFVAIETLRSRPVPGKY